MAKGSLTCLDAVRVLQTLALRRLPPVPTNQFKLSILSLHELVWAVRAAKVLMEGRQGTSQCKEVELHAHKDSLPRLLKTSPSKRDSLSQASEPSRRSSSTRLTQSSSSRSFPSNDS